MAKYIEIIGGRQGVKQAGSLVSVLLKIKGQRYMIGSYLPDNAHLSSTWQNDLITCLEKMREVFF